MAYHDSQRIEPAVSPLWNHAAVDSPTSNSQTWVRGLSKEVQQKLAQHRPETIGQAGRIQGVTPAAISLLLVWLKRRELAAAAGAPRPDGPAGPGATGGERRSA